MGEKNENMHIMSLRINQPQCNESSPPGCLNGCLTKLQNLAEQMNSYSLIIYFSCVVVLLPSGHVHQIHFHTAATHTHTHTHTHTQWGSGRMAFKTEKGNIRWAPNLILLLKWQQMRLFSVDPFLLTPLQFYNNPPTSHLWLHNMLIASPTSKISSKAAENVAKLGTFHFKVGHGLKSTCYVSVLDLHHCFLGVYPVWG